MPAEPLCPVTVKDRVVLAEDWLIQMVTSDIWELVMFPLRGSSTVAPLFVVASITVDTGIVGVWAGIRVGVG